MKKIVIVLQVAVAFAFSAATASAGQGWSVVDTADALTDAPIRETCAVQDEMRLCFSFQSDGVWVTARSIGSHLFDAQRFPAMRVDRNTVRDSVAGVANVERTLGKQIIPRQWNPSHVTWRAQVPSPSGEWTDTPPSLISEMLAGSTLLVRYYLTGGFQKDVNYSLRGFCQSAAQIYAPGAPRLNCLPGTE